ncbi:MAG: class I SAM-dependent methyltransferase [Bdellovibrionota bacterium]
MIRPNLKTALKTYSMARSALFQTESLFGPAIQFAMTRKRPRLPFDDKELFKVIRASMDRLIQNDVDSIVRGDYPIEVLKPENPVAHLRRMPRMLLDAVELMRRKGKHEAHNFSPEASDLLSELPEYYRRNFHYQGDGYLSEASADLYEHQVEILFGGTADAMRRLILAPLKKHFGSTDGRDLKFLEIGAGTGRATRFVRLAFPKAKIVAVDLSAPYLKKAQVSLADFPRHDFVEADAAVLPFLDESFDAVYSVFMFHELPREERSRIVEESKRVLKPGGFIGIVDSLQLDDDPELNGPLKDFPRDFHEPFYKDYIKHPLEDLFDEKGLKDRETGIGFFSKVISAKK